MEPFVCRATQPIPRFNALPGDRVYFDPSHPDILVLYRALHIRATGAVLNMIEAGVLEDITPPDDPSPSRPVLRLSSGGGLRRWRRPRPPAAP